MNNRPTLFLKHVPSFHGFPEGLYTTEAHLDQEHALVHFSGGSISISSDRLDEVTRVAELHGWQVKVVGTTEPPTKTEP